MTIDRLVQDFNNFDCIQDHTLKEILLDNKNTRLGKKYKFSQILNIHQYQEAVPLSTYEAYYLGNDSNYPVVTTLVTSGSTGQKKALFITEKALNQYSSYIYEMPMHLVQSKQGVSVHTCVFHQEKPTVLSSAYYDYLWKQRWLDPKHFVEGEKLLFSNESFCIPYVKLRLALLEENLISIQSIYLYEILLMLDYLAKNWEMILKDIEKQSFSIELPKSIKKELLKKYSVKRFKKIKQVLIKHSGKPPLKALWSKLSYISGIGQENAYDVEKLKVYLKDVPIYYFAYASTECMAGIATSMNEDTYALLPHSGFYEFLDENDSISLANQLKENQTYELIVTTYSGLYRYRTFDRLKFVGYEGQSPRFKILGRVNRLLNIAGEKVDEWSVQEAFHQVLKNLNLQPCQFYIGIDRRVLPARYVVFVCCTYQMVEEMDLLFDQALMNLNPNYCKLRALSRIDFPYFHQLKRIPHFIKENQKPRCILTEAEVERIYEETAV